MSGQLDSVVGRLEAAISRLERIGINGSQTPVNGSNTPTGEATAPHVLAYDQWMSGPFAEYLKQSKAVGGAVADQSLKVQAVARAQREMIDLASKCRQPEDANLIKLMQPQQSAINAVSDCKKLVTKADKVFNHVSTVCESVEAFYWVVRAPTPAPFIKENLDSGLFFGNRAIKDDSSTKPWLSSWSNAWTTLQQYVKEYHTTGLVWNARGVDAMSAGGGSSAKRATGPPPPPPPPPADFSAPAASSDAGAREKLFSQLNCGGDITKGLRRVTKDMQTHKNPNLRANAPIPSSSAAREPVSAGSKPPAATNKPPVFELKNKTWMIENQVDKRDLVVNVAETSHRVYISNCHCCTIQVKGKVNAVAIDRCTKTALVVDSVISSVEVVNCKSCEAQAIGVVPTFSVEQTDGFQLVLSQASLDAEVISSKSSEFNILIPQGGSDHKECPVTEQFLTKIKNGRLVTVPKETV